MVREGESVLLLERNDKLVSETSKVFHEWLHSGALYSLLPDHLETLRYLLGATDDLLEYYEGFPRMNLIPTESGIKINNKGIRFSILLLKEIPWLLSPNKGNIPHLYSPRKNFVASQA